MSPLSIVPGRIRLESKNLIGRKYLCAVLESKIKALDFILEAGINFRTGGILVRFDKSHTSSEAVIENIKNIIEDIGDAKTAETYYASILGIKHGNNGKRVDGSILHAVINIAGHMLVPKPLGILLHIAINYINNKEKFIKVRRAGYG